MRRWPPIIAAPPIRHCRPITVLPAMPAQAAIAECAPMRTLWPTCTRLSIFTPSSITVSSSAPRSTVLLAPISTSSPMLVDSPFPSGRDHRGGGRLLQPWLVLAAAEEADLPVACRLERGDLRDAGLGIADDPAAELRRDLRERERPPHRAISPAACPRAP